jgi:hypothetical protein
MQGGREPGRSVYTVRRVLAVLIVLLLLVLLVPQPVRPYSGRVANRGKERRIRRTWMAPAATKKTPPRSRKPPATRS